MNTGAGDNLQRNAGTSQFITAQVGFPAILTSDWNSTTGYSWARLRLGGIVVMNDAALPLKGVNAVTPDNNTTLTMNTTGWMEPAPTRNGWIFLATSLGGTSSSSAGCEWMTALINTDCLRAVLVSTTGACDCPPPSPPSPPSPPPPPGPPPPPTSSQVCCPTSPVYTQGSASITGATGGCNPSWLSPYNSITYSNNGSMGANYNRQVGPGIAPEYTLELLCTGAGWNAFISGTGFTVTGTSLVVNCASGGLTATATFDLTNLCGGVVFASWELFP